MYTQCPHCNTVFNVTADALRRGGGRVRCGSCLEVFDAIATLRDTLEVVADQAGPQNQDVDVVDSRAEAIPETTEAAAAQAEHPQTLPPDPAPSEPVLSEAATPEPVPDVLKEDLERAQAKPHSYPIFFLTANLLLMCVAITQYVWFMPADAQARYPQFASTIERFCEHARCSRSPSYWPEQVRLLSRDVRLHPRYIGVMQVAATLLNAAEHAQPYPRMRFTLYSVNGETIASRVFAPSEYLQTDVQGHMLPNASAQIALDLIAPEEAAVSFEFQFL